MSARRSGRGRGVPSLSGLEAGKIRGLRMPLFLMRSALQLAVYLFTLDARMLGSS